MIIGIENKFWSGIGGIKKISVPGLARVHVKLYQKILASLAKRSIDTKILNICVYCNTKISVET